jgi:hypothetical protein
MFHTPIRRLAYANLTGIFLASPAIGTLNGLPVSTATYTCRYNGSTHQYGVAVVTLDQQPERLEVRDGPAFSTAWAIDIPPHNRVRTGSQAFDERFEVYAPDRENGGMVLAAAGPAALLRVAEPFSMRTDGGRMLLWRSPGWSSPKSLSEGIAAAVTALGLSERGSLIG